MKALRLAVIAALSLPAACDWFEEPVEWNLPPETSLLGCVLPGEIREGEDIGFAWTGSDIDGSVTGYEYAYDDTVWTETEYDTVTITNVTSGEHIFRVRAADDDGDVDPVPAECAFRVTEGGHLVDRTVLVELFTVSWCQNCPNAEQALNSLLGEFGRGEVSIVAYHNTWNPVDELATDETIARIAWHFDDPDFPPDLRRHAHPTVVFDGIAYVQGATTPQEALLQYRTETDLRAAKGSPVSVRIDGEIGTNTGSVTAVVKVEDHVAAGNHVVRFTVIEDNVRYDGPYADWYDFVARDLLEDEPFELRVIGDSLTVDREFLVDESWVVENMDVIVFVQDLTTKEVLQSSRLRYD